MADPEDRVIIIDGVTRGRAAARGRRTMGSTAPADPEGVASSDASDARRAKIRQDVESVLATDLEHLPGAGQDESAFVVIHVKLGMLSGIGAAMATLVEAFEGSAALAEQLRTIEHLPSDPTARSVLAGERAWRDIEDRYGLLSGSDVAELLGSTAKNRHEYAASQVKQGILLGIKRGGRLVFPGFQFDPVRGAPVAGLADILAAFTEAQWGPESVAFWFTAPHGALDDREPATVLTTDPALVLDAARRTVAHW